MHIIIPMSGVGQRFINAGYQEPKPLVKIDGKTMVEHVISLFPGESKFTFICNEDHLKRFPLEQVLKKAAPQGNVVSISPHKNGPVYAVSQVFQRIDDQEEVIVNYCDFSCSWDYQDFLKQLRKNQADGGIAAYRGFHPHMLGKTNYAFMREKNQWMEEIQEKKPFTDNRMNEYASSGTYYFKSGKLVKTYFQELMNQNIHLNGEFYISLVYNLLKQDGLKTYIYEIDHMLQWGEPYDLKQYQEWSDYFSSVVEKPMAKSKAREQSVTLIPMAGKGQRFAQEGYKDPKPLIDVSGYPMVIQTCRYLPATEKYIFVCLREHLEKYPLEKQIKEYYPHSTIVALDKMTEGQACTCELGLKGVGENASIFIASCDHGMVLNDDRFNQLIDEEQADVIVFSFRHHVSSERNPQMYGWIDVDQDQNVKRVSVKKAISDQPYNDHAITGAFYFKRVKYFLESLKRLYQKNIRVNGEFYVDSCINEAVGMGLRVKVLETDYYIGWGTPDDLRIYQYWQKFFHECSRHPYRLESDPYARSQKHVFHST